MVKELINGLMVVSMWANGKIIRCMVMVCSSGQTAVVTRALSLTIKKRVKALTNGKLFQNQIYPRPN